MLNGWPIAKIRCCIFLPFFVLRWLHTLCENWHSLFLYVTKEQQEHWNATKTNAPMTLVTFTKYLCHKGPRLKIITNPFSSFLPFHRMRHIYTWREQHDWWNEGIMNCLSIQSIVTMIYYQYMDLFASVIL